MWRRLNKLEEVGRICSVSDMKHCKLPTNNGGYQDVQLYNLNVLNQLAMVELDCPVYVNEPKWVVSERLVEICMTYPEREQWHLNNYGTRLFPKWACDILDKEYGEDSTFLSEYRPV